MEFWFQLRLSMTEYLQSTIVKKQICVMKQWFIFLNLPISKALPSVPLWNDYIATSPRAWGDRFLWQRPRWSQHMIWCTECISNRLIILSDNSLQIKQKRKKGEQTGPLVDLPNKSESNERRRKTDLSPHTPMECVADADSHLFRT